MRDAAGVLLDTADPALLTRIRDATEDCGGSLADLHVWRIGPGVHAAIVSISAPADGAAVRAKLVSIPGLEHVTVECQ